MFIDNEEFYHIYRNNCHANMWVVGKSINFNSNKLNDFYSYYG